MNESKQRQRAVESIATARIDAHLIARFVRNINKLTEARHGFWRAAPATQ